MLFEKVSEEKYKGLVIKKLSNFCDKAPILLKFVTSERGVTMIHANSHIKYEFPWDYELPVKSFIYNIKTKLLAHYPRMLQITWEDVNLSAEEMASLLEDGVDPAVLPTTKRVPVETLWTITRVLVYKDIFLIQKEGSMDQIRYKMNKSCIHFLRDYRSGKFSLETAADYFFKNSVLLNELPHEEVDAE